MDLHSGYPFWLVKNGLLSDFPALDNDLPGEEIVIIGSGISGALAAFHLCEAGFQCTMIDKRILSSGSTWASTAHLNYEMDASLWQLCEWYGEAIGVAAYTASAEAVTDLKELVARLNINVSMKERPSLYLASDSKGAALLRKECTLRRKYALPAEWLDKHHLKQTYGFDREGALYHQEAAELDAYQLSSALVNYCVNKGALRVFTRTRVQSWKAGKNGVVLETDKGFTVRATHVICAAGYESGSFIPAGHTALHSTYALVSQPLPPEVLWKERALIWETARPYFYLRTTADNRVMIGGEDEPFRDEAKRDRLLFKKKERLLKKFHQLFPDLAIDADFFWCGTFGETRDSMPLIGKSNEKENIYYAMGYGGNGITFSMMAAGIICNQIKGHPDPRAALFSFQRKRK
ncbi:MAG TPA: FAD-dependent oxidoreductase [Flavisolibacter sp.]|jgi:glycine/D-amino acid oxidase-like deaminating enzyme|nr:FAD-dependent oxidoreductase [Flavisolibacter sp.]